MGMVMGMGMFIVVVLVVPVVLMFRIRCWLHVSDWVWVWVWVLYLAGLDSQNVLRFSPQHTLNMAGKTARRSSSKKAGDKRKKPRRSWNRYVLRVLKQVNAKGVTISSKAMLIVNSFLNDIFDKVATEAASVARNNKVKTVSSRAVQTAVRLALPGDLGKHAMAEGTKALAAVSK